jgi:hypothetical protein
VTEHIAVTVDIVAAVGIITVKHTAIVEKQMNHHHVIVKDGRSHLLHVLYFDHHHFCPFIDSRLGVMRGSSFLIPSFFCGYLSRVCFYIL